ncbi:MAG: methyltransferase domain-containing protein [Thermomicrobiales bacterium]
MIHDEGGRFASAVPAVLAAYPGLVAVPLRGYPALLWSDIIADRAEAVAAALLPHLAEAARRAPLPPVQPPAEEGEVAGITYQARGHGPPLLLVPVYLAPSQWEPLLPTLAEHYCTLTLGGPYLGLGKRLAVRASGGYGPLVGARLDALAVPAGGTVLDVGCGSGVVARRLARRTAPTTAVVSVDINAYLLREAAALARREGVADRSPFRAGNTLALPFPDDSFDAAIACTVLEELDADRALAELARVVRPGGRIAVAVRADDLPHWDSLPLRPAVRAKVLAAMGNPGASEGGCYDASLYRRFRALGLADVAMGPRFAVDAPQPALREFFAGLAAGSVAALDAAEGTEWQAVAAQAEAEGSYLWGMCYHCAVGTKP